MFSINTNLSAMSAYRYLALATGSANKATQRVSSGYRINSAADDTAGLAISEGLQSQIGGMTQAVQNGETGINVLQTADGALTDSADILQQMKSPAVQAASTGASAAITAIDNAITTVSNDQAALGGLENALQYQVDDLNQSIINTTASQSTIRDADVAQEMTNLAAAQLLQQSATASRSVTSPSGSTLATGRRAAPRRGSPSGQSAQPGRAAPSGVVLEVFSGAPGRIRTCAATSGGQFWRSGHQGRSWQSTF